MENKTYPASYQVEAQEPTLEDDHNQLRDDALYLGQETVPSETADNNMALGEMLIRFIQNVGVEIYDDTYIQVPYTADRPPRLVIDGHLCGAAELKRTAEYAGAAGLKYVMAIKTEDSYDFEIEIRETAVEGANERYIGTAYWNGDLFVDKYAISYESEKMGINGNSTLAPKAFGICYEWIEGVAWRTKGAYNVEQAVTHNDVGEYEITFLKPMETSDYVVIMTCETMLEAQSYIAMIESRSTTSFTVIVRNDAHAAVERDFSFAVFEVEA